MRLSNREVKNPEQIIDIIENSDVLRVGFFDAKYPYILPVSFGYEVVGDNDIVFYFHGAKSGKKIDLIKSNDKVCVECDIFNGYKDTPHGITADYKSFIGYGKIEIAKNEETVKGLELLLKHCKIEGYDAAECAALGITEVFKISVDMYTAKKRF